jgi:EAL domain-containing protein (putative c-di-GMP-specific phosphodiesterase class I)
VSASIGATLFPIDGSDGDLLIRHADQAMYLAKQAGRNCYHLFNRDEADLLKAQSALIRQINKGLEAQEFVLFYQPKVNMRTGEVTGAEALIRWRHPERGLVPPGAFLPEIEDHPIAAELGDWVIKEALAQMTRWRRQGLVIPVSVNVSARHLQEAGFVAALARHLEDYPEVRPQWLELEILETSALDDVNRVVTLMRECQDLGLRFALDDFGTGYSSLTYLRRLPAQLLKIDQSFIRDMLEDRGDLAIVSGVVGLAKAFQRSVIAEGVETVEHGRVLLSLGCDLAQGFGIAKPMAADDLVRWIAQWNDSGAGEWIGQSAG